MTVKNKVEQPDPFRSADWELADASAIQACVRGQATPEQQQRAINWVVYSACLVDDIEYRTNDRDHAFASGRRFPALQLRKLLSINVGALRQLKKE